ncbi:MAG: pyridoxine/pyridoxamine 5'-phosphate oxidase [Bacteriovoracaceae bacterium]
MKDLLKITHIPNPQEFFNNWLLEAKTEEQDSHAFALATTNKSGHARSRFLLFKGWYEGAFCFGTNLLSPKVEDIKANPIVEASFYWPKIKKQVRLLGKAKVMAPETHKALFDKRHRESQLASFISKQSETLESPQKLYQEFQKALNEFEGKDIPLSENWGAIGIEIHQYEFFQYGKHRLNIRMVIKKDEGSSWQSEFVYP